MNPGATTQTADLSGPSTPRSSYRSFFFKVLIATGVVSIGMLATVQILMLLVFGNINSMGSRAFWGEVERRVYALADAPDLPPEKKAKIVAALKKLSDKNKPYIDALVGR